MLEFKEKTSVAGESLLVNIGLIKPRPFRVRQGLDRSEELEMLAESISQHGIFQPLIVRPLFDDLEGYEYELVAGERRYMAAYMADFSEITVMVCSLDEREAFMVSLIENLQRENLNPIEETEGILKLLSLHLELDIEEVKSLLYKIYNCRGGKVPKSAVDSQQLAIVDQLFDRLGCFTLNNFVQRRLSLLNLSPELKSAIVNGLPYTKAKELNRISDDRQRQDLLQQTIDDDLSFRDLKKRVQSVLKDCDRSDDCDLLFDSQSDGDEQVGDSQGDINEQVFDSQRDMGKQVSNFQSNMSARVLDSQDDIDEEVSDFQNNMSARVSDEYSELGARVDDEHGQLGEQFSNGEGETSSASASGTDRFVNVVSQLETFAYEVIAPKLESDERQKFLSLVEELKQLVEA